MDIENYIKQEIENAKVSVAIDWLTVYYTFDILKLQALVKDDELTTSLTDDLYILKTEVGTQHFEKRTKVYFKNNEVATLMYQSRSELIYKSNIAKVDYKNSILYSLEFLDVHNELLKFGFKFSSFGRVDIAVDGCNYLVKFLNMYVKENAKMTESLTGYRMINSNYKRNVLNAGIYNPKIKRHEHFRIGSNLSKKYLTIYNKSYEIDKSKKQYIVEFWYKNGVIVEQPEQHYYKTSKNIYRFELRLKGEFVNSIKNFFIDRLTDVNFLISVIKYSTHYFFGAENIKTGEYLELLPYNKFKLEELEFVKEEPTEGLYMAKMTLHGLIKDIYSCRIKRENVNETIEVIMDRAGRYKLFRHLRDKLPEWEKKYSVTTPESKKNDVKKVIDEIYQRVVKFLYDGDVHLRAIDNQQPDATARFTEF